MTGLVRSQDLGLNWHKQFPLKQGSLVASDQGLGVHRFPGIWETYISGAAIDVTSEPADPTTPPPTHRLAL